MAIEITHHRAIIGNDINVKATAPAGKLITSVRCVLDGIGLQDPVIRVPVAAHSHNHVQAGSAGPFQNHTLAVTVTYDDGSQEPDQDDWQDHT